jgi:hypothetical protein
MAGDCVEGLLALGRALEEGTLLTLSRSYRGQFGEWL